MNGLDLQGAPANTRIVVAMSGGVDSSVTAALLKRQGYQVIGITLQLYDHGRAAGRPGSCCAGQDVRDARRVAERLDIPHYVLDYEGRFRTQVMQAFADSYGRGETPVPCVLCNQTVKFTDLLGTARDLGAAALATGHYARRVAGPAGAELHRAADPARDQSYFLFATTGEQLDYLRFPLGDLPKEETRRLARELDLPVAEKPDSQDICFVPQGRYARVVERLRPEAAAPGEIVDLAGRALGRHEGVIHYTVGQRRGLPGGGGGPLYVVHIDAGARRVVVGPRSALGVAQLSLRQVNWLADGGAPARPLRLQVKVRSTQPAQPAEVEATADGGAAVRLAMPELGVAPGQACVFYVGRRMLGGGWITRTLPAADAMAAPRPAAAGRA